MNLQTTDDGLIMRSSGKWVIAKLDYLMRYIEIFETSMREKFPTRFYVDLLAGPGKNRIRSSNEIVIGSPLISLTTKYPFSNYVFNEYDSRMLEVLKARTEIYKNQNDIEYFNQDCNLIVDSIVNKINSTSPNSLNLSFLDPEGLEVKWTTIEKLASVKKMDLILYYPQEGLARNIKNFCRSSNWCILDDFFGDEKWREIYLALEKENKTKNIHRILIDFINTKLSNLGYVDFSTDHYSEIEPLIRSTYRNAPLYRLLFASKHPLGLEFWKKVVAKKPSGQRSLF